MTRRSARCDAGMEFGAARGLAVRALRWPGYLWPRCLWAGCLWAGGLWAGGLWAGCLWAGCGQTSTALDASAAADGASMDTHTGALDASEGPDASREGIDAGTDDSDARSSGEADAHGVADAGALCASFATLDFDSEPPNWVLRGDALRESGYLELTGNAQFRKGAFYNAVERVEAGEVEVSFRFATGPNEADGADGFAVSVLDVPDETALVALLDDAISGGGLGYAVGGNYGDQVVEALHIEIDTFSNMGDAEGTHMDPTLVPHIEVTRDGDPAASVAFAEVPDLESFEWRSITVSLRAGRLVVVLDGETLIDREVSVEFSGGFVALTASTGFFTNHHRVDDLSVRASCR